MDQKLWNLKKNTIDRYKPKSIYYKFNALSTKYTSVLVMIILLWLLLILWRKVVSFWNLNGSLVDKNLFSRKGFVFCEIFYSFAFTLSDKQNVFK